MRYASVFLTILITWIAVVIIAAFAGDTDTRYDLYRLMVIFTLILFLVGFGRRR